MTLLNRWTRPLLAVLLPLALASAALARSPAPDTPGPLPAPSPEAVREAFKAADLDHDGFISLEEFHKNALQAWHALDRDGDGFISDAELAPLPRTLRASLLGSVQRSGAGGDGRLSFKDVMAARMADFDSADTDRDDRLSLDEVLAFRVMQRKPPR